jgi:hypothetical protein
MPGTKCLEIGLIETHPGGYGMMELLTPEKKRTTSALRFGIRPQWIDALDPTSHRTPPGRLSEGRLSRHFVPGRLRRLRRARLHLKGGSIDFRLRPTQVLDAS